VATVKLDVDTLLTLPTTPPAAGPDRAFDPALAVDIAACPVLAPAEPLLEVALTIPYAPPPITTTAAPMARVLVTVRAGISISFGCISPETRVVGQAEGMLRGC
jgi:hypothetical protein